MTEEQVRAVERDAENIESAAEVKKATDVEVAETPPESQARGILRDAIRKVMEEIERHEVEAKKHLQQARELRKDLRESIAFLQEQGEKEGHIAAAEVGQHRKIADEGPKEKAAKEPAATGRKHGKKK